MFKRFLKRSRATAFAQARAAPSRSVKYKSFKTAAPTSLPEIWDRYKHLIVGSGVLLGGFYLVNLEQAPVSGRYRFMIVPQWYERKIGEMSYRQTMAQFRGSILPDYHPDVRRVKSVMKRIIAVSGLSNDIDWQIHVVGGNYPPNAFVMPGGKVFVFQSLLPVCANTDGLATVLAHETAHQVCRHTAESLSKAPIFTAISVLFYGLTGSSSIDSLVLSLLLKLPASRQMEKEADYVGVMMMAKACFDPEQAIGLWQRMLKMEQRTGNYVPEFLSTHPASTHRIENIRACLPHARQIKSEYCQKANDFWSFVY